MLYVDSIAEMIEETMSRLAARREELEDKRDRIEDKAYDASRSLSTVEREYVESYTAQIEEIVAELSDLDGSLGYLLDWCKNC